jgi:hypothetical protein
MTTDRFVPKVHPATRPVEADDPMALHAISLEGDPEVMLRCVVQEYAWMGCDGAQILSLFRDPFYPALHELLNLYGEAGLRDRVDRLLQQTGVFQFQAVVSEEPDALEEEENLVQLGIRMKPPEGGSHA